MSYREYKLNYPNAKTIPGSYNGAVYNTETAKSIGMIEPDGYNSNDFNYYSEELFRTKSGKYFLYGRGGANSWRIYAIKTTGKIK